MNIDIHRKDLAIVSALVAIAVLFSISLFAFSADSTTYATFDLDEDDIWDESTKTLTIKTLSAGEMEDYMDGNSPWNGYRTRAVNIDFDMSGGNLTSIGAFAFSGFELLTSFTVPAEITKISGGAFKGTSSLTTYNSNSVYVPADEGILFSGITKTGLIAYPAAKGAGEAKHTYSVPATVDTIWPYAFSNAVNLGGVDLKYSIKTIGDFAFADSGLVTLNIPENVGPVTVAGVTTPGIGTGIVKGCFALEKITVDAGNTTYVSADDALYKGNSSTKTALLAYPAAGMGIEGCGAFCPAVEITAIADYAFYGASNLEGIIIPDKVLTIGESAFRYCTALQMIQIPENVVSIGAYCFDHCTHLTIASLGGMLSSIPVGCFTNCSYINEDQVEKRFKGLLVNWDCRTSPNTGAETISVAAGAFDSNPWNTFGWQKKSTSETITSYTDVELVKGAEFNPSSAFDLVNGNAYICKNDNGYLTPVYKGCYTVRSSSPGITFVLSYTSSVETNTSSTSLPAVGLKIFQGGPGPSDSDGPTKYESLRSGISYLCTQFYHAKSENVVFQYPDSMKSIQNDQISSGIQRLVYYPSKIGLQADKGSQWDAWNNGVIRFYVSPTNSNLKVSMDGDLLLADGSMLTISHMNGSTHYLDDYVADPVQMARLSASKFLFRPPMVSSINHAVILWGGGTGYGVSTGTPTLVEPDHITGYGRNSSHIYTDLDVYVVGNVDSKESLGLTTFLFDNTSRSIQVFVVSGDDIYGSGSETYALGGDWMRPAFYRLGEGETNTYGYTNNNFTQGIYYTTNQSAPVFYSMPTYQEGKWSCSISSNATIGGDISSVESIQWTIVKSKCYPYKEATETDPEQKQEYYLVICGKGDIPDDFAAGISYILNNRDEGINGISKGTIDIDDIQQVIIAKGATSIGDNAFKGFSEMYGFNIASSVTSIGKSAFQGCSSLPAFYVPSGVTYIGQNAFDGCTSMTKIMVDHTTVVGTDGSGNDLLGNQKYKSIDGVLYEGTTTVVRCPEGMTGSITLSGVTKIAPGAFLNTKLSSLAFGGSEVLQTYSSSDPVYKPTEDYQEGESHTFANSILNSINLPANMAVKPKSFLNCTSLVSVMAGDGVTIGSAAFGGCTSLTNLSLLGTKGASISIGSDSLPTKDGYYWYEDYADVKKTYDTMTRGHAYVYATTLPTDMRVQWDVGVDLKANYLIPMKSITFDGSGTATYDFNSDDPTTGVPYDTPWSSIPNSILYVELPSSLTTLGDYTFRGLVNVEVLDISAVTKFGKSAFEGMSSISQFDINSSVTEIPENAFKGCSSLASVSLSSALKSIGPGAFMSTGLESLDLPSEIVLISQDAFRGTKLTQIIIPATVTSIGSGAFDDITTLDTVSFQGSSGNVTITADSFPKRDSPKQWYENGDASLNRDTIYAFNSGSVPKGNIYTIDATWGQCGDSAGTDKVLFRYLATTKTLYISGQDEDAAKNKLELYTDAANNQFTGKHSNVTDLDKVEKAVIRNVGTLGAYMFYGNSTIKDLYFNGTDIGESAMQDALNLESVDIVTATTIGHDALKGTKVSSIDLSNAMNIGGNAFKDVTTLTEVDLRNAASIGTDAFSGCIGLTDVTLKQGVAVGNNAFKGDIALTNAKIDLSKIGTIGNNAFQDCTGLTSAPVSSATTIGKEAFKGCTGLTSVDLSDSLASVGATPFSGLTAMPTISVEGVPKGTLISADYSPMVTKDALQAMLAGTNTEYGQYAQLFADIDSSSITMTKNANDKNLDLYGHVLKVSKTTNTNLHGNITVADSYTSGASTHRYFSYTEGAGWTDTGATSSLYTAYTLGQGAIMVSGVPAVDESIMLYGKNYTETDVAYNVAKADLTDLTAVLTYKGEVFTADQVKDQFTVEVDGLKLTLDDNYTVSMAEIIRNGTVDNKNVGNVYVVLQSKDPSMDSGNLLLEIAKKHITVTFPEHINYGDEPIDKLVMNGAYETAKVIFSGDDALQELSLASKYIGTTTLTLVGPADHPMSTANYIIDSYFNLTEGPFITSVTIDSVTFTVEFYKLVYNEDTQEYEYQFAYYIPVESPSPVQLPSVSPLEGFNFAGWYKGVPEEEGSEFIGWTGEYYAVTEDNLKIYAKYLEIGTIAITTWYHVDDQERSSTIDSQYGYYVSKSSVSEDSYTYVIAKPVSGYSVRISVQHAAVEALSDGIFKLVPMKEMLGAETEEQYHQIILDIYVLSVSQGIGDFRVAALTDGNIGALVVLDSYNEAGLVGGTISFGGVYYSTIAEGTASAVRVYGAITNSLLVIGPIPTTGDPTPVPETGIAVADGSLRSSNTVILDQDEGAKEIYHIYARYVYSMDGGATYNVVTTPAMYGNNVVLQT